MKVGVGVRPILTGNDNEGEVHPVRLIYFETAARFGVQKIGFMKAQILL